MQIGLQKMEKILKKLNYKVLLLTAFVSANANADIFSDIGDWVSETNAVSSNTL